MRRLKHKHTRRAVQFYEINHGFRKPFKAMNSAVASGSMHNFTVTALPAARSNTLTLLLQVILDGNFVHAVRQTR